MTNGKRGSGGPPLLPLLFLTVFFYIPVLTFLLPALFSGGGGPAGGSLGRILLFTIFQAFLSALLSILGGLPGAWLLSRYRIPGQSVIKALLTVPFVLPPILAVLGFVLFFGKSGLLNSLLMKITGADAPPLSVLYSLKAILLGHVFYNIPIAVRFLQEPLRTLPRHQLQAAESLGASFLRRLRTIVWPHLRPSLAAVFLLIFLYCFMSFAIILVLGGGPDFTTIEIKVYQLVHYDLNFALAGRIGLAEILITLTVVLLYATLQNRTGHTLIEAALPLRKPDPFAAAIGSVYFLLLALFIIGPLFAVVFSSFRTPVSRGGALVFSIDAYRKLLLSSGGLRSGSFRLAALRTLLTAGGSAILTTILLMPGAEKLSRNRGRWQVLPFLLPMGVSSLFLGSGYLLLGSRLQWNGPWALLMLMFIQSAVSFPICFRAVHLAAERLPADVYQTAEICGAGPFRRFRTVSWPLLRNGFLTAAVFSFALSAGEMTAAVILLPPNRPTIPLYIYQQIGGYEFSGAAASGTLLILLCTLAFAAIDRFERRRTWII